MLSRMPLETGAFVAVDLETTGSIPGRNSIIEVGAARLEAGVVVATFREFVRPSDEIPPSVTHVTGITAEMLSDAPPISDVLERLRAFLGGAVVVAHNHRFDLGFLDYEAERLWGASLPRPVLDTLAIARRLHPDQVRHNLRELAGLYRTAIPTHRALDDAVATAEVFAAMTPSLVKLGLGDAGNVAAYCGMRLQSRLASKLVMTRNVCDGPGVFLFRDEDGRVIYVDRAKNVRTRVRGHFYSVSEASSESPAMMAASVDCIDCASELDAILLESRLLERYQPMRNQTGERGRNPFLISVDPREAFPAVRVVHVAKEGSWSVGPFTNRWAVETLADGLRVEFGLRRCVHDLSASKVSEACVHRAERTCPRPCVQAVDEDAYRSRLAEATQVFEAWGDTFRGRVEAARVVAAASGDNSEAARYRDMGRALERCLSAMRIVREETSRPDYVLVDGSADRVAVHVLSGGRRVSVVRARRDEVLAGTYVARLEMALARVARMATPPDPLHLSPRHLRDLFLIRGYREHRRAVEAALPADLDEALAVVSDAVQRHFFSLESPGTAAEGA